MLQGHLVYQSFQTASTAVFLNNYVDSVKYFFVGFLSAVTDSLQAFSEKISFISGVYFCSVCSVRQTTRAIGGHSSVNRKIGVLEALRSSSSEIITRIAICSG